MGSKIFVGVSARHSAFVAAVRMLTSARVCLLSHTLCWCKSAPVLTLDATHCAGARALQCSPLMPHIVLVQERSSAHP